MITRADPETALEDHVVLLQTATWADYERLDELRGDSAVPRLTYLEGDLEIMSPSRDHERIKSVIGRLVDAYCLHQGIRFSAFGSWTLKRQAAKSAAEPDECYVFGEAPPGERPDLAIEVEWSSRRLNKLEVYRRLQVQEVWVWRQDRLHVHALRGERYEEVERSVFLPDLDLTLLVSFLDRPTAFDAIRDFTRALGAPK